VRALYDFQPTEQGELGFQKGDIVRVIESVYRDWWKGELRGKTGIFPVNYVVSCAIKNMENAHVPDFFLLIHPVGKDRGSYPGRSYEGS
jgi:hypothetical protein